MFRFQLMLFRMKPSGFSRKKNFKNSIKRKLEFIVDGFEMERNESWKYSWRSLNQLISTKSFKYISIYSRKIFAIKISNLKNLSPISFKQIYDTKASPFDPDRWNTFRFAWLVLEWRDEQQLRKLIRLLSRRRLGGKVRSCWSTMVFWARRFG